MSFSNGFKKGWWALLFGVCTLLGINRLHTGIFNDFDKLLFIFWAILALFPIISEVSIFGVSVKREIEAFKEEIKSLINNINVQSVVHNHINTVPATTGEVQRKLQQESKEASRNEDDASSTARPVSLTTEGVGRKTTSNPRAQERLDRIAGIEQLVISYLIGIYGPAFKPQMRISDEKTNRKIIADGVIIRDGFVKEVIEIKYITAKSFDNFYYLASRFVSKACDLLWKIPVRFVVVSEEMNPTGALVIKEQINKLNSNKSFIPNQGSVDAEFFKITDGRLEPVRPESRKI